MSLVFGIMELIITLQVYNFLDVLPPNPVDGLLLPHANILHESVRIDLYEIHLGPSDRK